MCEITEEDLKWTKTVENGWKKYFDQLSGAANTLNKVEIHNKECSSINQNIKDKFGQDKITFSEANNFCLGARK